MKKKKYFSYIAILLIIVYLFSASIIIGVSIKENSNQEREINSYLKNIKSPQSYEEYNKTDKFDEFIYDSHIYPYYNKNTNEEQPLILMIFDRNKNLIASSGSYIEINFYNGDRYKTKYCNIDKYLTNEMIEDLKDFTKNNPNVHVNKFDYNIENEKIIPVKVILTNGDDELELTFSNDIASYSLSNKSFENTSVYIRLLPYNSRTFDLKNYKNLRDYAYSNDFLSVLDDVNKDYSLIEYFKGGEYNYSTSKFGSNTGAGYANVFIDLMEIEDSKYYFVKFSYFNDTKNFFGLDIFQSLMIEFSALFTLFAIIILVFSNKFFDKNEQLENARTSFANAAAHELKTPLAIISNQCECIMENVSPEKNMEYVNSIYDESKRMTRLVKTLIYYNKVSSTNIVDKKVCNLKELAQDELNKYTALFDNKNIHIETNLKNAEIACNKELISLVIDNFLSNAVKYTEENKKVIVSTGTKKKMVGLSVFNEGAKISKEDADHIWEELYRADKSRKSNSDSTGMGLALSKKILELHGFKYDFRNLENGVEFYFYKHLK